MDSRMKIHIARIYNNLGYMFDKVVLQLMPMWFLGW
jgi:hypothetical protein